MPDSVGNMVPAPKGFEQSGQGQCPNHQTVENSQRGGVWKKRPSLVRRFQKLFREMLCEGCSEWNFDEQKSQEQHSPAEEKSVKYGARPLWKKFGDANNEV